MIMRGISRRMTGLFAIFTLFCVTALSAQNATITGNVIDNEANEALPGANVVVSNADIQTGAATNSNGDFKVEKLFAGTYTVSISYIGYETKILSDVTISDGETKNLEVILSVQGIQFNSVVISASKREEKSLEAPASISVLEAREISTLVASSSSSLLKNVTGVDVSSTGVDRQEIVLRGFNNAFSGAAYILTDYRQAAAPSLAVNLHSIMPNMTVDLDRVEVVRGPGSALYGAGVDAGVVHYLTKDPFSYPGTTASFAGGEQSMLAAQFRHAGTAGKVGYKITGQYTQADDFTLNSSDPIDAALLASDSKPRNNDFQKLNVNGLIEYRFSDQTSLIANGGFSQLDATVLSGIGTLQADAFALAYGQLRFKSGNFFAQGYLNKNDAGDSFVYGSGQTVVDKSEQINLQAQYDMEFADGKEQVIVGVDYDRTTPDTEGTIYGRNESRDLISETGVYVQSLTKVSEQLALTAGIRFDYNNIIEEVQLSPRVALVFKPNATNSFRATFNRAFSSPGNNSNFLDIVAGQIPGTSINIRGRGSARGHTFDRNPAFQQLVGSDLIAYSLNPASLGAPQPVGLPLDATYASVFAGINAIPISVLKTLLPAPLNGLPDANVAGLVALLDPSLTQVSGFSAGVLGLLNPTTGAVNVVNGVTDIAPLKETTTQTLELGYKGLISEKLLVAIDGYYMNKKNFVGPLLMETPFVLVPGLANDLTTALASGIENNPALAGALSQFGLPAAAVADLIVQLAADGLPSASTPVAIVAANSNAPALGQTPELMLAYRNFGNVNLWGADVSLQFLASDRLSFFGNVSIVSDDFFDNEELDEAGSNLSLALNAAAFKSKFGFAYNVPFGLSFNASGRYTDGFPVESGPYVGDVDSYFLLDLGLGYDLGKVYTGMRFDVTIQNILDNEHREFIGAPEIGRLAMARLSYTIR